MSIFQQIWERSKDQPHKTAVEDGDRKVSYGELAALAETVAVNLQQNGLKKGEILAFRLPNSPEQCALMLAAGLCGYVMLPIRYDTKASDIGHSLSVLNVRHFVGGCREAQSNTLPMETLTRRSTPGIEFKQGMLEPNDPSRIGSSSGTTGAQKYFVYTHAMESGIVARYQNVHGWSGGERCYVNMPMGDIWAVNLCLATLSVGGTLVIARASETTDIAQEINRTAVTALVVLPWQLRVFLQECDGTGMLFPGVRFLMSGGSGLSSEEMAQVRSKITPNLYQTYAMAEIPAVVSYMSPELQLERPGSSGRIMPEVEIEVVDSDHVPLDAGKIGLIRVKTDPMLEEYLNNPEATSDRFRDGWFYPMDVGYMDNEGFLYLVGRSDDRIDCMGAKFYPVEVERVLSGYPGIDEAVVFSWPDTSIGEVPAAVFVSGSAVDPEKLYDFCRKRLESYKVPRYYLWVKAIPRSRTGKVQLQELRKKLAENLVDLQKD